MQADTLKLLFTYFIALIVIVGGGAMLFVTRLDPTDSQSAQYGLLIAGFIGFAIQFVFARESATQATRAAESTLRASQTTTTVSGDPPTTVVRPAEDTTGSPPSTPYPGKARDVA
jgi:hypothetical protein